MPLIPVLGKQGQVDLCEFETSLIYWASSRTARKLSQKNKIKQTNKLKNWLACLVFPTCPPQELRRGRKKTACSLWEVNRDLSSDFKGSVSSRAANINHPGDLRVGTDSHTQQQNPSWNLRRKQDGYALGSCKQIMSFCLTSSKDLQDETPQHCLKSLFLLQQALAGTGSLSPCCQSTGKSNIGSFSNLGSLFTLRTNHWTPSSQAGYENCFSCLATLKSSHRWYVSSTYKREWNLTKYWHQTFTILRVKPSNHALLIPHHMTYIKTSLSTRKLTHM